jgi:two-component system chemotaxis sensor kinase CheA
MPNIESRGEIDELWSLFAQEGREVLDQAEQALLHLETAPTDTEAIRGLFRAMHTFKGNARVMGLTTIETLAHHAEDLVGLARDHGAPLIPAVITVLLNTVDKFRAMLTHAVAHRRDEKLESIADLVARIRRAAPPGQDIESTAPPAAGEPAPAQLVDPATDPAFVRIFLEMAQEELGRLHISLESLSTGEAAAAAGILDAVDALHHAASQMGYDRLMAALDAMGEAVGGLTGETRLNRLFALELEAFEELTVIQESAPELAAAAPADFPDIAWMFRHWHADRVFANLAQLVDQVDQLERAAATGSIKTYGDGAAIGGIVTLLQNIYHSCRFYKIEPGAQLSRTLEDLYARTVQGEKLYTAALPELTRAFVTRLGAAIDAIKTGQKPALSPLTELITQARALLFHPLSEHAPEIDPQILERLHLPPEFDDVFIPANLVDLNRAMAAGQNFFTILADLNRDEHMAAAFYQWTQAETVQLITSATVYQNDLTLYNFLLTTPLPEPAIRQALAQIDPAGQLFSLKAAYIAPAAPAPTQEPPAAEAPTATSRRSPVDTVSAAALAGLMESVGQLSAAFAGLENSSQKLADSEFIETLAKFLDSSGEQNSGIEQQFNRWQHELSALVQAQSEMGAIIDDLRENAHSLTVKPAAAILAPLTKEVAAISRKLGQNISLQLTGADIELDQTALKILAGPVQKLVRFAAGQGPVEPGAPLLVTVTVSIQADSVQVVIQDNGPGLDNAALNRRVRQLGGSTEENLPVTRLAEWLLKPEFGPIGREPINLAKINAVLQTHQGMLQVREAAGGGIRFLLELPLDTLTG